MQLQNRLSQKYAIKDLSQVKMQDKSRILLQDVPVLLNDKQR